MSYSTRYQSCVDPDPRPWLHGICPFLKLDARSRSRIKIASLKFTFTSASSLRRRHSHTSSPSTNVSSSSLHLSVSGAIPSFRSMTPRVFSYCAPHSSSSASFPTVPRPSRSSGPHLAASLKLLRTSPPSVLRSCIMLQSSYAAS